MPILPPPSLDTQLDIRCPRCGGRAAWTEPFAYVRKAELEQMAPEQAARLRTWGRWTVRERFPSVAPWKAPARGEGYTYGKNGVVRCGACHLVARHRLRWPEDLYFRWSVRGTPLWAWDAEHACVLRDYIAARHRDPFRYPRPYPRTLMRLPRDVLAGRNRERVAGQIEAALRAAGVPLDPPLRARTAAEEGAP